MTNQLRDVDSIKDGLIRGKKVYIDALKDTDIGTPTSQRLKELAIASSEGFSNKVEEALSQLKDLSFLENLDRVPQQIVNLHSELCTQSGELLIYMKDFQDILDIILFLY